MDHRIVTKNIRGLTTGWIEAGDPNGPIIFFLHGYPDTPEAWQFQLEHFKTRYHLVAPFGRGVRPSQKAKELSRYGTNAVILDHLEILKTVNPDNRKTVICLGHDVGSVHAWALAPLLSKQLGALVIINGASLQQMVKRLVNPAQQRKSWYISTFLVPLLADRFVKTYPAKMLSMAHNRGKLSIAKRPSLSASLPGVVNPIRQYRALMREVPETIAMKPKRLKAPVLVLYGNEDPFLIPPSTTEMTPYAKDFTIRILPGGHWLHRDKPDEINQIIDGFLSKVGS